MPPLLLLCCFYCLLMVFRLWFFAGAPTKAQVLLLVAMQWKAALWILGAFNISPTSGIKALVVSFLFTSSQEAVSSSVLGLLLFLYSMH